MLRLLRQVSFRQLQASWGRTTLVVGGVATGVSLIVAIQVINASVLDNLRRTIELIAGPAALEVTLGVGEVGFSEATVETVRADPAVAAAVPLVRGTISLADDPSETLQLFGADLTAEEDLERYRISLTTDRREVLRSMDDPGAILLAEAFATRHALGIGQHLKLSTPAGVKDFTVRGLLAPAGVARVFGGQLAVMDLPAAQLVLGTEGRIDQVDVLLRPEADVTTTQRRLEAALPSTLQVARPEQRGAQYETILASFQAMLTGLSLLCLVAGVYIIYNTTSTGAVHRALVIAGLRVTGASADQLFRLLMLEALVLGVAGTGLGIPGGIALARLLTGLVSDSMGVIFQLRFPVDGLSIEASRQVAIAAIGIGAALFAAYFAARRVTALDPLEVMRADLRALAPQTGTYRLVLAWLALVGVSALALVLEVRFKSIAWGNFGSTVWNASVLVIAVPLVSGGAAMLSRILSLLGAEGRVAAESLFRSATRTGVTIAAVALVLAIGITVASLTVSFRKSVSRYYEEGALMVGDLVVSAVSTEGGWLETPLPEDLATDLQGVPGVSSVEGARFVPGQVYRGQRITLFALSDGFFNATRYGARWYRQGDPVVAARALLAGEGANVATALADRFQLRIGDAIELDTPTGSVSLPIVGVVRDYASDRGTVIFNRRILTERWGERSVNRFNVFLQAGVSTSVVRDAIRARLGQRYRLKILLPHEVLEYHAAAIDRAFAFTDAMQLLVIIVTVAGIFDLLLASIWERRRELAVWRVVGADERAVRRTIVIESATIGGLGALLGVAVGLITAWIWIGINFPYLLGYELEYHLAFGATAWYVVLAMLMTVLASYGAARQATRQSVLQGIQTQ